MTPPTTRSNSLAQQLTLDQRVLAEIEEMRSRGQLGDGSRTEPRCHVCCEVESKELVNKLIAAGLTNREIAESCDAINMRRQDRGDDRAIGARNVWVHRREHFNIDKPAQAVVREILERRAEENSKDHINGVGHVVTPYAVLETTMFKGYQRMNEDGSDAPTIKETIDSAVKLHEFTRLDSNQHRMADLLFQMDRIITAARAFVPEDKQDEFLAMVEGRDQPKTAIDQVVESVKETAKKAIREFTPPTQTDEDDDI